MYETFITEIYIVSFVSYYAEMIKRTSILNAILSTVGKKAIPEVICQLLSRSPI